MSTTKEILEGDTSRFAFKAAFQRDPDRGVGATAEESLSWGGFQIWVEGQNLCAHLEAGTIVESVHWYLLPLFEWLSACWEYLLHEERLPLRNAGDDSWNSLRATAFPPLSLLEVDEERWSAQWQHWWLRHSLLACRQGGLFPDVVIRRWRDRVELSWGMRRLAGQPAYYRFLANCGFARLSPAEIAQPLYDVLRQAIDYLVAQSPDSARLKRLREGVESLRTTATDKRLAILAGLGTTLEEQEERWQQVRGAFRNAPAPAVTAAFGVEENDLFLSGSCQAALMFGSVAPNVKTEDVLTLAKKLIDFYSPDGDPAALRKLTREESLSSSDQPAWTQGYRLAQDLLEELSMPEAGGDWIDVKVIYDRLGIHAEEVTLLDRDIRALALAGPQHHPSVLLNPEHATNIGEPGRRFTWAHELCHLLFDRGYGARLAIASGPWAPRDIERRANAFAAMLLMPPDLIRRLSLQLSVPLASTEGLRWMAQTLQTSFTATLEHLKNLGFLTEDEYTRIQLRYE